MKVKSIRTVIIAVFVLCVPSLAFAGQVRIPAKPGTDLRVTVVYFDSSPNREFAFFPNTGDGFVTITVPNQEKVLHIFIDKVNQDGRRDRAKYVFPNSPLPALEPFRVPEFAALDPGIVLTSDINVNAFLATANPFTVGQTFSVVHGMSTLSDAIIFTDEFGNPFNGIVIVEPFVEFVPVPEPTTLVLFATGLAGVAIKMRKKLKSRKSAG